jgi:hypothetical protein
MDTHENASGSLRSYGLNVSSSMSMSRPIKGPSASQSYKTADVRELLRTGDSRLLLMPVPHVEPAVPQPGAIHIRGEAAQHNRRNPVLPGTFLLCHTETVGSRLWRFVRGSSALRPRIMRDRWHQRWHADDSVATGLGHYATPAQPLPRRRAPRATSRTTTPSRAHGPRQLARCRYIGRCAAAACKPPWPLMTTCPHRSLRHDGRTWGRPDQGT